MSKPSEHVDELTRTFAVCGEVIALCADHAKWSDELSAAAEAFRILASVTGEPSPELESQVAELLGRFGIGASNVQH